MQRGASPTLASLTAQILCLWHWRRRQHPCFCLLDGSPTTAHGKPLLLLLAFTIAQATSPNILHDS